MTLRVSNRVRFNEEYGTVKRFEPDGVLCWVIFDGASDVVPVVTKQLKSARGFAAMSKEQQLEYASRGGKAAHAKGKAYKWTSEQAREAGKKGGVAAHAKGGAHEFDRESARVTGSKGGKARAAKAKERLSEDWKRFSQYMVSIGNDLDEFTEDQLADRFEEWKEKQP